MRRLPIISVGVAGLLACACLDPLEPEVGPPLASSCVNQDSDEDVEVSYSSDIVEIFSERCLRCHTRDGENPIGVEVGGLDLSTYSLVRAGGTIAGTEVVLPGSPCSSVLVQKVGASPPFGARMPLNGPPYLSEPEQQRIRDWIAEGARDN